MALSVTLQCTYNLSGDLPSIEHLAKDSDLSLINRVLSDKYHVLHRLLADKRHDTMEEFNPN